MKYFIISLLFVTSCYNFSKTDYLETPPEQSGQAGSAGKGAAGYAGGFKN
jgi:hypothetical protein